MAITVTFLYIGTPPYLCVSNAHARSPEKNRSIFMQEEDTEERYRVHLAFLISRTKSRGGTRYFNQFVNRCRDEAAAAFPKGAAAARKKDMAVGGVLGAIAALFSFLG
jgi:hypothetical protein